MKISVIMQVYLGDYPGSRSNPKEKFIRAVNSFLAQTYNNKELIIVADGCSIAPEIFYTHWSGNDQIKFAFVHKTGLKMYEKKGDQKFYRGLPKRIGCAMAEGDLITYMDSDDIILPTRLEDIYNNWKDKPNDIMWSSNPMRWWANDITKAPGQDYTIILNNNELSLIKYGIDKKFILASLPEGYFLKGTWAITHRKEAKAMWNDTIGISEDIAFVDQLKHSNGFRLESPTYVLCHYSGYWDY